MDYFIDDDHRIVCRAEIFNPEENKRITCYSLGYDAIGIAPRSWRLMDIYSPRIKFLRQLIRYVGILVTSISVPIILSSLSQIRVTGISNILDIDKFSFILGFAILVAGLFYTLISFANDKIFSEFEKAFLNISKLIEGQLRNIFSKRH